MFIDIETEDVFPVRLVKEHERIVSFVKILEI